MINYTSINSVLPLVADSIRSEDNIPKLLSYILNGYRDIYSPVHTKEEVLLLQLKDHKTALPDSLRKINLVTYMSSDPNDDDSSNLEGIETQTVEINLAATEPDLQCVGNYILSHRLYLLSDYFQNNFEPMKYIGINKFVCTDCNNRFCHPCNYTYSVDENKILHSSQKEGFVCIIGESEVKIDGVYQIIDHPHVKRYLAIFAEYQHIRNRMFSQEQGAMNIKRDLSQDLNIWYNKARTAIKAALLNRPLITELTIGRTNARFLKDAAYEYRSND